MAPNRCRATPSCGRSISTTVAMAASPSPRVSALTPASSHTLELAPSAAMTRRAETVDGAETGGAAPGRSRSAKVSRTDVASSVNPTTSPIRHSTLGHSAHACHSAVRAGLASTTHARAWAPTASASNSMAPVPHSSHTFMRRIGAAASTRFPNNAKDASVSATVRVSNPKRPVRACGASRSISATRRPVPPRVNAATAPTSPAPTTATS